MHSGGRHGNILCVCCIATYDTIELLQVSTCRQCLGGNSIVNRFEILSSEELYVLKSQYRPFWNDIPSLTQYVCLSVLK